MPTILAIDDRPDNLLSLSALLKRTISGCHVVTALSGCQGIEMAKTKNPDTILLDIHMPEMDGFEVCKILKSKPGTKHIPVILLTAVRTGLDSRVKGLELGADAFLVKPVDQFELAAQVKAMLRIKHAEDIMRHESRILEQRVIERTDELLKNRDQLILEIEERRQAEDALKESEEKFRVLYNSSPDMYVSVLPGDASILLCNETVLKKTGYSREEIIGFPIFILYHDECMDDVKRTFQQFVKTGIVQDKELILKRKDGSKIHVSLNVTSITIVQKRDLVKKIL